MASTSDAEEVPVDFDELPPVALSANRSLAVGDHIALHASAAQRFRREEFQFNHDNALHKGRRIMGNVVTMSHCVISNDVLLRGDIARIQIGRFVLLGESGVVRPPMIPVKQGVEPVPVAIGDHVYIGARCVIEAAVVGSCVVIERDCVVGPRAVIGDGVMIQARTVVPSGATLTSFGIYAGNPAELVGQLNRESALFDIRELVLDTLRRTELL
jgi:dynactin-5